MTNLKEIDVAELKKFKADKKLSNQALANKFGVSKSTIKRRLKIGETERQKQISEFATRLSRLVSEVDDDYCRKELNRAINKIRQYQSESVESKFQKIISSIKSGAVEIDEIADDCDLPISDTKNLLDRLVSENRIIKQPRGGVLNRGRKTKFRYSLPS